jgi:glycogen(starch) synthase
MIPAPDEKASGEMPMRILMLSWEYPPHIVGGLGQHVADLAPALAALGVDVHVVTPLWKTSDVFADAPDVTVHRVSVNLGDGDIMDQALRVNQQLEREARQVMEAHPGFELIHAHDWLVSFAGIALKRAFGLPLLATVHATEFGRTQGRLDSPLSRAINEQEWRLVFEAWRVVVCSNFMATELIGNLGVPADKVDVISNGVRADRFNSLKGVDHRLLRAKFALPHEQIVFNLGRMVREKGLHVLVEAMPEVLTQVPNAKFVLAGKPDSWGYWSWCRGRAEELGVDGKCYFTGFLPDDERDALLTLADVAVFPSLYEPFGIVAPEAMAAGAPVVASSAGGLAEVVIHRLTGLTAYPDSPASLAWAIVETLRNPVEARARARSAYRRVVREYDWARIAAATAEVYGQVAAERKASGGDVSSGKSGAQGSQIAG